MSRLTQQFCDHTLYIQRRHKDTVPRRDYGKVLYVDVHNVWCFIKCVRCGKVFHTEQPMHDRIAGAQE